MIIQSSDKGKKSLINRVHIKNCIHFKGIFKDHIRFSRTAYQECNFTDFIKMNTIRTPFYRTLKA